MYCTEMHVLFHIVKTNNPAPFHFKYRCNMNKHQNIVEAKHLVTDKKSCLADAHENYTHAQIITTAIHSTKFR